ncbi:MAG: sigma-70 family RNA polymerase sigma factor [Acidobacteriota bacterium]|nr:sigma-70 family RNA polymerase sigma factor [Acidobacteriota bacterium]
MTNTADNQAYQTAALVERAREGDSKAFASLVDLYKDRIYTYVLRMCHDPDEAADIAQDTFLRAFQSLPNFRGASSFQTWLYRIASNLVIDSVRRRQRRDDGNVSLDAPVDTDDGEIGRQLPEERRGPAELAESADVRREVLEAVAQISPKLRPVLVMYDLQGMSYQEIAEILGCPLGTVKSRLFNARNQLRELLEERQLL